MPNRRKARTAEKYGHLSASFPCKCIIQDIQNQLTHEKVKHGEHGKLIKALHSLGEEPIGSCSPLNILKNIGTMVKTSLDDVPDFSIAILIRYFLVTDVKHPLRRAIASLLESFRDGNVRERITNSMAKRIVGYMELIDGSDSIEAGRHLVDVLVTCLDNFPLGQMAVEKILEKVVTFLRLYLNLLNQRMEDKANSSIALIHNASVTLKCCTMCVQRCVTSVCTNVDKEVLNEIVSSCKDVLQNDNFEGDCWNTAGILCAVVWKVQHTKEGYLEKIKLTMEKFFESTKTFGSTAEENYAPSNDADVQCLSDHAKLSLCGAFLAIVDTQQLVCNVNLPHADVGQEKCLLVHLVLPYVEVISARSTDLFSEIIVTKCYVQWTVALRKACKGGVPNFVRRSLLDGQTESENVINKLLQYSFTKLEHPVDAIRHQANDMLTNLLFVGSSLSADGFSDNLVDNILRQNWQKRSTFTALNCLLNHTTPEFLLSKRPDLLMLLLKAMRQQSLVPYASEVYKNMAARSTHSDEEKKDMYVYEKFLDPLLEAMCNASHHYLRLLIDYCYAKLLTVYGKDCVSYLKKFFNIKPDGNEHTTKSSNPGALAAVLACLRLALSKGYLKETNTANSLWNDVIDKNALSSALVHQDSEIRITAFALLCESTKPSTLIADENLQPILQALPWNVSSQDPAFRQKLLNILKKLLLRLCGNIKHLLKACTRSAVSDEDKENSSLKTYFSFVRNLGKFAASQLYNAAPYPKRTTCLSMLATVVEIFSDQSFSQRLDFEAIFSTEIVHSVFDLLSDPYDDVRCGAFALLSVPCLRYIFASVITPEKISNLEMTAMSQACQCSKPELCCDASYHLKLCAVFATDAGSKSKNATILRMSRNLLSRLDESIAVATKSLFLAAANGPMYGLLHCLECLVKDVNFKEMSATEKLEWRGLTSRMISTCFQVSKTVLPVVGSVSPEGHLPEIEAPVGDEVVDGGLNDAWNELPEILRSIVIGNDVERQDEMKTRALAQTVLICCWRSAKESSLLLQELTSSRLPLDSTGDSPDGVLSWGKLLETGEHLRKQLMEARHRGAFEIAYSAFKAYCPRLWTSEHTALNSIPEQWMHSALADIEDPDRSKELCATRRSAGLPFFMQALLGSSKNQTSKRNLHCVMTKLLSLCDDSGESSEKYVKTKQEQILTKVHSLNILRGLVKDASLGEEILPYVSRCLQVALIGFGSSLWAIRNSSTLLYSCLVTRIFGVKRDKEDHLSVKNRLSGHEFFTRLPGLHAFLLTHLEEICACLEKGGHHALNPVLHPILLLLCRIYPSTMQMKGSGLSLAEFVSLLLRCRSSAVFKTRVAASVALANVVSCDNCLSVLKECCHYLVKDVHLVMENRDIDNDMKSSPSNRIHGTLLQIKAVVEARIWHNNLQFEDSSDISAASVLSSTVTQVVPWLATRKNNCPVTRASMLDLFAVVHEMRREMEVNANSDAWIATVEAVRKSCIGELDSVHSEGFMPGHTLLQQSFSKILMLLFSNSATELLSTLERVSSCPGNVVLVALQTMNDQWDERYEALLSCADTRRLEAILIDITRCQMHDANVQTQAYLLLSNTASTYSMDTVLQSTILQAAACNSAQSFLLAALIAFQSSCMPMLLEKIPDLKLVGIVNQWVETLASSSQCYENTDDVRLTVGKALLKNPDLLLDPKHVFGETSVRAWQILIRLICDEEAEIRKVASDIVYEAMRRTETNKPDHPYVDTLGLERTVTTLLLTHGTRHASACRQTLLNIAVGGPTVVPVSLGKNTPNDRHTIVPQRTTDQACTPGLFDRSTTNTYWDAVAVSRVAKCGLTALEDPELFTTKTLTLEALLPYFQDSCTETTQSGSIAHRFGCPGGSSVNLIQSPARSSYLEQE